jgi:predicted lipoprotein
MRPRLASACFRIFCIPCIPCVSHPAYREVSSMRRFLYAALVIAVGAAVFGCKLVKNDAQTATGAPNGSNSAYASAGFDPNAMVASMWSTKILPDVEKRATDYPTLRDAIKADPDAAGKKYGYRGKDDGAPWNFPTRVQGTIVDVDTQSSQGTVGIDIDGSGKAAVIVDIGPTVLGTTLRDTLDFISFTNFRNQIEYAQFGTALNSYAATHVMKPLPRDTLKGKQITVTGAFSYDSSSDQPEIVPLSVKLGDKS